MSDPNDISLTVLVEDRRENMSTLTLVSEESRKQMNAADGITIEAALAKAKAGWDSCIADLRTATEICRQTEERIATLTAERDEALRKSSRGVWRCFHCDEVFDTPGGAQDHFGGREGDTPGCLLKVQLGDERGWLMELRKEQEAHEEQLQRALDAEREVEGLECRVASLSSDMKTIKPFAKGDSMRDVFNVYDSMEGRALAAEDHEQVLRGALERLDKWFATLQGTDTNDPLWMMRQRAHKVPREIIKSALATPAQPQTGGSK